MGWNNINNYAKEAYGCNTFDTDLLDQWLDGKNVRTWSIGRNYNVPNYLITGRSTVGFPKHFENIPPYFDHATFFKSTNPLKIWLVYHPYREIEDIRNEIEKWGAKENLSVSFFASEYSWYNKGNTSMVVITTK